MKRYIDAEKLIAEIERQKRWLKLLIQLQGDYGQSCRIAAYENIISLIEALQQEQPIKKVYRVENEAEQKGLWRKFDGSWEPLFDMLTDGQCRDMPMEDSAIYREGGKRWFASAPSKETLRKWFSKRDLEELTTKGFTISEFEVIGHKKISDFEYIFTRDNIISRNYLKVSDIYPQEQANVDLDADIEMEWDSFNKHLAEYGKESEEVVWLNWSSFNDVARHFYGLRNRALEEAARHVYESWMGGTMNAVRRDMVELGRVINARKEK